MRIEEIDDELKEISFEYFYWFSRFEYALKENKFLKEKNDGAKAEPSWDEFRKKFKDNYILSDEAIRLIQLHPKRQFVGQNCGLYWNPVGVEHCNNDLCKVVTMLITVRNNLFHGGKHGDTDVDNKIRNVELLTIGKIILLQLAQLSEIENDYTRYY